MSATWPQQQKPPHHDLPLTDELSAVVARMSGLLLSEETVETSLGLLSALAQETVPGSTGAGVTIVDERGRRSSGSTNDRVRRADRLQYELEEGPCLTAATSRELVRMDDLAADPRWPRWAAAASRLGLRAAMSAPMVAGDISLGALKVYADEPGTFGADGEQRLLLFAAQSAIFVANLQTRERAQRCSDAMRQAIRGRDSINMAKGLLMGRNAVDEDTAFRALLARAEQEGTSVTRTAQALVESAVRRGR
jgi:GAF domain-containing protein